MSSFKTIIGGSKGRQSKSDKDGALAHKRASWRTGSTGDGRPVVTYATRVSGAFALTAAMTILILVTVLAVVWDNQFQTYTRNGMKQLATDTARLLAVKYDQYGYWSDEVKAQAKSMSTISSGIGIQVLDADDRPIYDDTWITDGAYPGNNAVSLAPSRSSMEWAPIISQNGTKIGTVRVWAFGSEGLLTQNDMQFRENSYHAIFLAAIVAIVLALVLGFLFSRGLVNPVRKVAATAEKIKDGDLTARTGLTGIDEIAQLGEIFDAMANSLEKDRELERRLTTDVAHELRTPLMAILATVEAIQDGVFPADEERLATIGGETRRLSRLVDALLQLSRLESGATKFTFIPTNIVSLANSIAYSHEAMIADADMTMEFVNETGKDCVNVELDQDRVRQAVVNLISNAVRYTDAGGKITVSVGCDRKNAWISVTDTGIGIAKEDIDRVFGRFWRAEESRNRAQGGLGVGLSVTKEVVQRHRGYIQVESEVGVGTTMTIVLPKTQPNPKKDKANPGATGDLSAAKAQLEAEGGQARKSASTRVGFTDDPSVSGKHDFTDIREAAREKEREKMRQEGKTPFDDDELIG